MEEIQEEAQSLLLTAAGHKRLTAELEHLKTTKRLEIAERIRESKDHGEFAEDNNELDEIKNEQAIIESRIAELKTILSGADVMKKSDIPTDHVGLGSYVVVANEERDIEFQIRIVASIEADAEQDLISDESPMGDALMGLEVDQEATFQAPAGTITYKVKAIANKA